MKVDLESKELMAACLRKIPGLSKVIYLYSKFYSLLLLFLLLLFLLLSLLFRLKLLMLFGFGLNHIQ